MCCSGRGSAASATRPRARPRSRSYAAPRSDRGARAASRDSTTRTRATKKPRFTGAFCSARTGGCERLARRRSPRSGYSRPLCRGGDLTTRGASGASWRVRAGMGWTGSPGTPASPRIPCSGPALPRLTAPTESSDGRDLPSSRREPLLPRFPPHQRSSPHAATAALASRLPATAQRWFPRIVPHVSSPSRAIGAMPPPCLAPRP